MPFWNTPHMNAMFPSIFIHPFHINLPSNLLTAHNLNPAIRSPHFLC